MLELIGLTKRYVDILALDGSSMTVGPGRGALHPCGQLKLRTALAGGRRRAEEGPAA